MALRKGFMDRERRPKAGDEGIILNENISDYEGGAS